MTLWIVLVKELRDSVRDRRSVLSALVLPLLGPALASMMMWQIIEKATAERVIDLPIVGAENAPGLVHYLEQEGIHAAPPPADAHEAVRRGASDTVLVIPPDYAAKFDAERSARVALYVDSGRPNATGTTHRVKNALNAYSRMVGALRQLAHGENPERARVLSVDDVDVATPEARAAVFLNFVVLISLLSALIGGMHTAIDLTAGERERGTLEPLLLTPATRRALALGKWLAAAAFAALSVVTTVAFTLAAVSQVPLARFGLSSTLGFGRALLFVVGALPLTLFSAGLQLCLGSFARTVKEAQTYMGLMLILPTIGSAVLMIEPLDPKPWMMTVPVLAQQVLLTGIIRGEPAAPLSFVLSALCAVGWGLALALATAALLRRERIIYGR